MSSVAHEADSGTAKRNPWCTLITVTYNSQSALREFWTTAGVLPSGVEWIVVDNNSDDESAELAAQLGATRVIRNDRNLGFSASNNLGLEAARGDFVGFVNPDVNVNFDDLQSLRSLAVSEGAIVSPQLLNADGSLQPNGRGFPLLIDKVRNRLFRGSGLAGQYLLFAADSNPRNVCWLMGATAFGMRETIDSFGGWDDHFFLYYEDKDFCLRAWKSGVPVILDPRASWTHGWARETTEIKAAPWRREIASMLKFYWRYPEFLLPRPLAARLHRSIAAHVFGAA